MDSNHCQECGSLIDAKVLEDLHYQHNLITQADHLKPPPPRTTTISTRSIYATHVDITFKVSLIGGESKECSKKTNTTIEELMRHLHHEFNLAPSLQRLMFNGQQLKVYIHSKTTTAILPYTIMPIIPSPHHPQNPSSNLI